MKHTTPPRGKGQAAAAPKMAVEMRPTQSVRPYERNAKKHAKSQVAKVAASIREFGWAQPLVVDAAGSLIIGHCRLEAAKSLGLAEVPVVVMDALTDAQVRALRLADNRLNESAWDMELVTAELKLMDVGLVDLSGFSRDLLLEKAAGDDDVPKAAKARARRGDTWLLGGHRVTCGDATSPEDFAALMGGVRAAMVFTDPPYGVDHEGISNDDRAGLKALLDASLANMRDHTEPGGACYVFHSDRCADIFQEAYRKVCHFSSMVIWRKPSLVLSQTDYQSIHEPCLYGWFEGKHKWHGDRKQVSVWDEAVGEKVGHTTPKPVSLIVKALANSSGRGDVVLDPFGGSGSTLIACEKSGRSCRMMELDPKYVDVIVARWERLTGKKAARA